MVATTRRMSSSGAPWRMTMSIWIPEFSLFLAPHPERSERPTARVPDPSGRSLALLGMRSLLCRRAYRKLRAIRALNVLPLSQPHPDNRRHSGLLHCHTVNGIGCLHRPRVMSDDQELGIALELLEQAGEAAHVGIVERSVDFVHQTEGTGLGEIDAEKQRHRNEGPLTGGQQVNPLSPLAPGGGMNVDLALERVVRTGQPKLALAAPKEGLEHLGEVGLNGGECLDEHGAGGSVDLPDGLDQGLARADQI